MRAAEAVGGELSAEDLLAAVRVHADRVHDAVRRQGAGGAAAAEVVEASALDTVARAGQRGGHGFATVGAAVGWWFSRARALGQQVAHDDGELPVGRGLLAGDEVQELLAEALEHRPERERTALLLRDAYDLPADVVAAALGTDAESAMRLVGRARTALLPEVYDTTVPTLDGHAVDEASLARLSEGRQVQARDATTRRHAQACGLCRPVVEAQEDARRLLVGMSVVAMPDAARERLLDVVAAEAGRVLPTQAELAARAEELEEEDVPRRLFSPLLVLLALLLAAGTGVALGAATSGDEPEGIRVDALPPVTAPPAPTLPPDATPRVPTTPPRPTTSVFTITPSPSPTPTRTTATPAPSGTAPAAAADIGLSPATGPNGTVVTVTGEGFTPAETVTVTYLDRLGQPTGSTASAVVSSRGTWSATLTAQDPTGLPGAHEVQATDGQVTATATFTATA